MSSWGPYVGNGGPYANLGLYGAIDGYGSLNLTQSSPTQVFTEPMTVTEMLSYLNIEPVEDDSDEYNLLYALIQGAREQAEILQGRDLVRKQWDLTYDYWTSYRIRLRAPLVSVDLAQYTDSNGNVVTLNPGPAADYIVDTNKQPGIVTPPYNGSWPTFTPAPSSAILWRFTSGFANTDAFWNDSGARIKVGMKLLISAWYSNRIPFEIGSDKATEYPYAVTSCLSYGSIIRAR